MNLQSLCLHEQGIWCNRSGSLGEVVRTLLTCLLPEIDRGVLPWVRFWPVSVHEV